MEIIREIKNAPSLNQAEQVYNYLDEFKNQDREMFIVIGLDTKNKPCYREIAHIGVLNAVQIGMKEVFKKAILMSCNSIIVAHNHPSNKLEPSDDDLRITEQIKNAGKIIGIELLDHLIITDKAYKSII